MSPLERVDVTRFARAREIVRSAQQAGAFPAAVIEVGSADGPLWQEAVGTLTYDSEAPAARVDTIFDLASLTKVIATTTLVMQLVETHTLALDDLVTRWIPEWRGEDRATVTVADLLAHTSGLTSWVPLYRDCVSPHEFETAIASLALEYPPRSRALYSDLGFILLGFILERAGGASLADRFAQVRRAWEPGDVRDGRVADASSVTFRPPVAWRTQIAPTEFDPWRGRLLVGEVHDENGWALSGVAGHAGLFGSAPAVGRFARTLLAIRIAQHERSDFLCPDTVRAFTERRPDVPGASRALGWDMMLPTSSCGTRMSPDAFGHTGFTGTSLWLDPAAGIYIVFLTNRVHPTRTNEAIRSVRPAVHDAIMEGLASTS